MNGDDSKIRKIVYGARLTVLCALAALAACSQTTISSRTPDLAFAAPISELLENGASSTAVSYFQDLCLRAPHSPADGKALALRLGWQTASNEELQNAGLGNLRKAILEIPGGGARFREEQEIVSRRIIDGDGRAAILVGAFERRIAGQEVRSSQCSVYLQDDFLKTCETLGQFVGRAPDRNQAYPQRGAHFIQWAIRLDSREALLNCARTPQSVLLPYEGITLSVSVDHSGTARKSAFGSMPVRSTPPAFDG